jgi:riboflavin synthase alpha subunit
MVDEKRFSVGDRVKWDGECGTVTQVRRDSITVEMDDGMTENESPEMFEWAEK